jgi:hypothetical protein
MAQKHRLDKLSQFLGQRIAETDISSSSNSVLARPLSENERKVYQKKQGKLTKIFGKNVPSNNIVNYATSASVDDLDVEIEGAEQDTDTDSEAQDNERKKKLQKVRKLRGMLGIDDASKLATMTEKALEALESSIRESVDDPEVCAVLMADLKTIKDTKKSK